MMFHFEKTIIQHTQEAVKYYVPHHDMSVPPGLSVVTTPSNTLTIECKILSYP